MSTPLLEELEERLATMQRPASDVQLELTDCIVILTDSPAMILQKMSRLDLAIDDLQAHLDARTTEIVQLESAIATLRKAAADE